ncbi:MAG: PAS domain S-box protein [Candidatus Krumholzibacteriia bacterium]
MRGARRSCIEAPVEPALLPSASSPPAPASGSWLEPYRRRLAIWGRFAALLFLLSLGVLCVRASSASGVAHFAAPSWLQGGATLFTAASLLLWLCASLGLGVWARRKRFGVRGCAGALWSDARAHAAARDVGAEADPIAGCSESLIGAIGEGLCGLDAHGHVTFLNPAAQELLGWSEDELRGKHFHEHVHAPLAGVPPRPAPGSGSAPVDRQGAAALERAELRPAEAGDPTADHERQALTPAERPRPGAPQHECAISRVLSAGEASRVHEDLFVCRDGSRLPVSYVCTPVRSAGRQTGAIVAFQDITERKQAEAALRLQNERQAVLLAASARLFASQTLHERLQVIVDAIQLLGWRRVALTLRDEKLEVVEIVTAGLPAKVVEGLKKVRATGEIWRQRVGPEFEPYRVGSCFYHLPWRDLRVREHLGPEHVADEPDAPCAPAGRWDPRDVVYAPLVDVRGRVFGIISLDEPRNGRQPTVKDLAPLEMFLRDAASALERMRHQAALQEAESHYRSLFEMAGDGILVLNDHGAIVDANAAVTSMLGYSRDMLLGRTLFDLHPPEVRAESERLFASLFETGSVKVETEFRCTDGSPRCVELSCAALPHGRRQAILRDVTQRRRAEGQIRAAFAALEEKNRELELARFEAEEANHLKSEFLANTSHELRTPLSALIGYLQLIRDDLCDSRDEERKFVRTALDSAEHLLALINDVLDLAKIEAGRLQVEIGRVVLGEVFHEVEAVTRVKANESDVDLRIAAADGLQVRADPARLLQVLLNLVGNAIKFTGKGGHISVRARVGPGDFVLVDVCDDGIGIPSEKQHVIFETFAQGDGSMTRKFGGTGLGLAISRKLVELMGGFIAVRSAGENRGATFTFAVPLLEPSEAGTEEHVLEAGTRVLVVAEDSECARYLETLLQEHGFTAFVATRASEGFALARQHQPEVVVIDGDLGSAESAPEGWDLVTALRGRRDPARVPVVLVEGYADGRPHRTATGWVPRSAKDAVAIDSSRFLACVRDLVGGPAGPKRANPTSLTKEG